MVAKNIAEIREMAKTQYGRDPQSIKFLALLCPILGRTEEEAQEKFRYYRSLGSIDGALALFGGWTGIDLDQYGDDQELRQVESNAIRSAVEGWSKATPEVPKWTKKTVGEHITVGGLGATAVGTPQKVADIMERWVSEADVDGFNIVSLFPSPSSILPPSPSHMDGFLTKQAYAVKPGTFKDVIDLLLPELRRRGLFWDDYAVPGGTYRENIYRTPGQTGPRQDHPASRYRWNAGVEKEDHKIPDN